MSDDTGPFLTEIGMVKEIERLRADVRDLRIALEELEDWQNGPPLVTYTEGWTAAMKQARAVLERTAPREPTPSPVGALDALGEKRGYPDGYAEKSRHAFTPGIEGTVGGLCLYCGVPESGHAPAAPKAPERGATLIDTLRKLGAAQYIIDACIKADAEREPPATGCERCDPDCVHCAAWRDGKPPGTT